MSPAFFPFPAAPAFAKQRPEGDFQSSLDVELLDCWLARAQDPERCLGTWVREGVPLGIEREILGCNVFPPSDKPQQEAPDLDTLAMALARDEFNYRSIYDLRADSEIELSRVLEAGFGLELTEEQLLHRYPSATVSRMAILVKPTADGGVKRRLIVDLRRSGANAKADTPERPILPRPSDAIHSLLQNLKGTDPGNLEVVSGDFSDAYFHLRVHPAELQHCVVQHIRPNRYIVWIRMCFGLKSAPLVWSRFAAAFGRLL